jgi:esterase/lipase
MELNGILFPCPACDIDISDYKEELIFIPKDNKNGITNDYIPCLFLPNQILGAISKQFLLYFHGNAEDIFNARQLAEQLSTQLQLNVIVIEYPGYSIYKNDKCSDTVLKNALIVFDYLTEAIKVDKNDIYVFGRSIGTAPASYLASKRNPGCLILMSPFTSVRAVAENLVGVILKFLISERYI